MRKSLILRSFLVLVALIVLAAACQEQDATPPAGPDIETPATAVPATVAAQQDATGDPTGVAPEPTAAAPEPVTTIDWPPQAVASDPLPGEELPLEGTFSVRFDQPMDQASVEEAWSVDPALEGSFSWPREDTVVFTPAEKLARNTSYRIQIAESAQAQTGLALQEAIAVSAQTMGDLAVTQVMPEEGTNNVQTDGAITAVFNRPVVPLVSASEQAGLPQPLSFDPPISGSGEWLTTSVYRFVPDDTGLAGATTYTVTVDAGLEDISGATLPAAFSWSFSTEGPQVVMVEPPNRGGLVPPTRPISITFNMPMDRASTEAAVALNPGAPLNFAWEDNDEVLVATPAEELELDTLYEVTVGASAQAASGQATMGEAARSEFSTLPFPGIKQTYPADGEITSPWQTGISIDFLSPMDMDTLEDRIIIDPAPERVVYRYNEWIDEASPEYSSFNLYLEFPLAAKTDYTITIPADAADPYGNTFGEPYTWRFTTPGASAVASFNLPQFISQISTSFPSELQVIHRNVSQLEVNLYQPDVALTSLQAYYPYEENVSLPAPLRTWTIPVNTPEDEIGITAVALADGDVLPTGVYVVTVSAPEVDPDSRYWQVQRNVLLVADSNLAISEMPGEVHAWITDLDSGQPLSDREVTLYDSNGQEVETAVSDASGLVSFAYEPPDEYQRGAIVVSGVQGESGFGMASSNWTGELRPWNMGINYGYGGDATLFSYVYTDRPIYRPGDTVYFKGIVREPNFGRYTLPETQPLTLAINSFNYYGPEDGFEETLEVAIDANGLFDGEFTIPADGPLGTYNIMAQGQDIELGRSFTVAEYRKPEFQVILTPTEDELLRGEATEVTLEATYFFGGSAAGLQVQWSIYEDSYAPQIDQPGYSFGDAAGFTHEGANPFFGTPSGPFGEQLIDAGGEGTTDENGRLTIPLPADLLDDANEGGRKVTVEARVIDITDFPVTATTSVIYHAADVYVGVRPAEFSPAAGQETAVELLTVDWDGDLLANQDVEVVFYERVWESTRDTTYGMYMTTWTPVDTEVARIAVVTDSQGKAAADFVPETGGSYVAVATVTDSGGRLQFSSTTLWVVDEDFAGWRSDPRERSMQLVPDETDLQAGDSARILVQSPFNEPTAAWIIIERGNLVEQQVITLPGGGTVLDLPMKPEYAPNVFVTVVTIKPAAPESSSDPYADMRVGITELQVAPDQFDLDVQLTPREELFAPGDTAVYDVLITRQGQPVSADFSLALVDLAVLTLKDDNAPPILQAFYSPVSYRSQLGSGLLISGEGLAVEVPLEGGGLGGGGGGDVAEAALARLPEEEDDVRSEFPDTAYWAASVQTDASGQATVEIPLPDSLTTWRLSSKAVTTSTEVGQGATDVIVSLPLLIRPIAPRFFTVGDVVQLGAVVNNNTADDIEATVALETVGVTLSDEAEQVVIVPANGSQRVRWEVAVEDVPFADLTFRVQGGDYRDASKPLLGVGPDQLIPVYRYDAQEFSGTAGELDEEGRRVEAVLLPPNADTRRGSVDIRLDASLGAAVLDALQVLQSEDEKMQCASEITNRLWANAAVEQTVQQLDLDRRDLTDDLETLIPQDIAALQEKQQRGGGWAWCFSEESDPWLSGYALLALSRAEQNGHTVDSDVISRAQNYVRRQLLEMDAITDAGKANRQAFFLYVLSESGANTADDLDELVAEHRGLLDPYARALLVVAYESQAAGSANQQTLLADLNDSAIISASGAHWEDAQQDFFNLNSDVRGTAMVIDALARVDPDSALAVPAVRWLMVARTIQGWPTAHESAWSIYALSNWMAASGELEADYDFQVGVNGVPFVDGAFGADNLLESESVSVPVGDLLAEETNFVDFQRAAGDGRLYYTMFLNSFISAENIGAANHGLSVQRTYYDAACDPEVETCEPITEIATGQRVRVVLNIVAPSDMLYLVVEDPLPAGAEGIDPGLNTSSALDAGGIDGGDQPTPYGYWGWWYFNRIEYRDEKVVFLSDFLPAGTYQYTYYLEPLIPGTYQVMPATAYQDFFPDVFGRSEGMLFEITAE